MWSTMVNHMDGFLSLKEAASFSGRSESTLKRLIVRVLDEHRHDQSLIDQVIKKRQAAKGYYWFISKEFLIEEFGLGEPVGDRGRSTGRPKAETGEPVDDHMAGQRTLESEIIAILKEQLRVKDEQIRNFQERDREYNILLKTFQDKLFLLEGGRAQDDPLAYREQTSASGREEAAAAGDPFGAAAPWAQEGRTAASAQDAPEAVIWMETETPVTEEELRAAGEGAPAEDQETVVEQADGRGEQGKTEGAPETTSVTHSAPVEQATEIAAPAAGVSEQAGGEEETVAPS